MISVGQILEIIAQYRKHGWTLRRVLLSDELRVRAYNELVTLSSKQDGGAAVEFVSSADVDAAWFSRASKAGEAWELRHLSTTPFALFEVFDLEDEEETREEARKEMETRLKTSVIK
ncbi:MAG: hypothetical protein M3384_13535 [Acidobacteriota bacterium]|nr:hypothetical protein [Acidobacteriota bacterium]